MILFTLAEAEGFGINTNILETNVINLAAVLFVVINFAGQNLTALLAERKRTIINNLSEATLRAEQAAQNLNEKRLQFDLARQKAAQIREEGLARVQVELNNCNAEHEVRIARLNDFKQETISFYQQKAYKQAYTYALNKIMLRVKDRLTKGLTEKNHMDLNSYYVARFSEVRNAK
jgi:F-type H+-transporting ATPase subunit b